MAENRAKELRIQQIKLAFANNMRAMREKRGWTQPQLADLVGLHRVTIVRLEMNRRHPSFFEACLIADALGVSIAAMRGDLGATTETLSSQ